MDTPTVSVILTHFSHGSLPLEAVASTLAQPGPSPWPRITGERPAAAAG